MLVTVIRDHIVAVCKEQGITKHCFLTCFAGFGEALLCYALFT